MTTAQVVETSVTVNNNSPIQDYVHPDDQTQPTFEMTPGFKPFTDLEFCYQKCAEIMFFFFKEATSLLTEGMNISVTEIQTILHICNLS